MENSGELINRLNEHLFKNPLSRIDECRGQAPAAFIVGLPRSGTTLLHQLMARHLRLGYIDNLVARFWASPCLGIALSRQLILDEDRASMSFSSDLGRTKRPHGPHEFGYFWNHWFNLSPDMPHNLSETQRAEIDTRGLGDVLGCIQQAFNMPLVFKNLICGFQADIIKKAYPNSFFILMERNHFDTGRSILAARKRHQGGYDKWWSLAPSSWPEGAPKKGPAYEVAWQILESRRELLERLGQVNHMTIQFTELLENPDETLERIVLCFRKNGAKIERRRGELGKKIEPKVPPFVPEEFLTTLAERLEGRS